ncbi:MAG: leucine-rich repeat domain-containing protein [Isosphaeraceae bacterium]
MEPLAANPVGRWRYPRLSVRTMIALVLITGAGVGWLIRSARIQREAVAALQKNGGAVNYNWEVIDGKPIPGGKPPVPRWLVDLVGIDYFGHVTDVTLMWTTSVPPDARIAPLEQLTRLEGVHVFAPFGDAELARLEGLKNLSALTLGGADVTDLGLRHLKGLHSLSVLSLVGTEITDAGLARLGGLTSIHYLDVGRTQVTDAGLPHLKGLADLSFLDLYDTRVTDRGLAHLKGLSNLTFLRLESTRISDAGLAHLKGHAKLSRLDLRHTQVTADGVNDLKHALPRLTVRY